MNVIEKLTSVQANLEKALAANDLEAVKAAVNLAKADATVVISLMGGIQPHDAGRTASGEETEKGLTPPDQGMASDGVSATPNGVKVPENSAAACPTPAQQVNTNPALASFATNPGLSVGPGESSKLAKSAAEAAREAAEALAKACGENTEVNKADLNDPAEGGGNVNTDDATNALVAHVWPEDLTAEKKDVDPASVWGDDK